MNLSKIAGKSVITGTLGIAEDKQTTRNKNKQCFKYANHFFVYLLGFCFRFMLNARCVAITFARAFFSSVTDPCFSLDLYWIAYLCKHNVFHSRGAVHRSILFYKPVRQQQQKTLNTTRCDDKCAVSHVLWELHKYVIQYLNRATKKNA